MRQYKNQLHAAQKMRRRGKKVKEELRNCSKHGLECKEIHSKPVYLRDLFNCFLE